MIQDNPQQNNPRNAAGRKHGFSAARSYHRDHAHQSAHQEGPDESAHARSIPQHPLIPRAKATLVDSQDHLLELVTHLRQAGSFAYDSEFIGELTYIPILCLLQVASIDRIALIDPLARLDLIPFWELVADPAVEKIVHAGQQDLEPVFRHLQRPAANVFDTQVAAGFIALSYPTALSKLARELLNASIGKGLTFTDWAQRPLSAMQLRYAADDVRYLPAMRQLIAQRLDTLGHTSWAAEECQALCQPNMYRVDPRQQYTRLRGANSLNPAELAVLCELTVWRDATARAHDLPARTVVRDEVLVDLARNPVKSIENLSRIKGLPRPVEMAHGTEIVETVARGLTTPPEQRPVQKVTDESPVDRFRADALWATVECIAFGQSIDPSLVASRQEVGLLSRYLGSNRQQPAPDLRILRGWRREAVGRHLLAMVDDSAGARFQWADGALRMLPATHLNGS